MDTGSQYNLKIHGGNPTIHKAFISTNDTGSLFITPRSDAQQYATAVVISGQKPHTLTTPQQPHFVYNLWGPAGMGTYRLDTSSSTEVQGIGSSILHDGWYVHRAGPYMMLRHKGLDSGFWIAVPNRALDGTAWEIRWLQPSGATVTLHEGYVMVEIEVVEVRGREMKREL